MRGRALGDDREAAEPLPWSRAWRQAALGPSGFWTTGPGVEGPAAHFRTSAHAGRVLARALAALVREVDDRLEHPERLHVVDVGAGRGELLTALVGALDVDVRRRLVPVAIDVRPRPTGLDPTIAWTRGEAPESLPPAITGLLLAHELLDEVPLDVVQLDDRGRVREVLVDRAGAERVGRVVDDGHDLAWLHGWWPLHRPGDRAEVGRPRDELWRRCVDRLALGTALAVDYGHTRRQREAGRFAAGTLTAYRGGRQVPLVPDGRSNLTAHVAVDSVAAAVGAQVTTQQTALRDLGVRAALPPSATASTDPSAYADALQDASDAAELLDPSGLGSFAWIRVDR